MKKILAVIICFVLFGCGVVWEMPDSMILPSHLRTDVGAYLIPSTSSIEDRGYNGSRWYIVEIKFVVVNDWPYAQTKSVGCRYERADGLLIDEYRVKIILRPYERKRIVLYSDRVSRWKTKVACDFER
ncbi:MAG: hypothetical protein WC430_00705 [Patescibacteria group bacterium]